MNDYPREDKPLVVCLADNTRLSGLVNIAGRSVQALLADKGPDVVLYDARDGEGTPLSTVFIGKRQILWIAPSAEPGQREETGLLKRVLCKLANGQAISGKVDVSGHTRLSDYFHACDQQFYEIHDASIMGITYAVVYVGVHQILWKQPVE